MHATALKIITKLQKKFRILARGKESFLAMMEDAELAESVYNSNAIENSTLTLDDTEKILFHQVIPPHHSKREVFEAVNLAKVTEYLIAKAARHSSLTEELILIVHGTLLSHINDDFAGRFRRGDEFVRVGPHIAPTPEHISKLMGKLMEMYHDDTEHILHRIIVFHLEFERIHPFCDGNGRVGRALLNYQLRLAGYPPIIIRNKGKRHYYDALNDYDCDYTTRSMEHIIAPLIKESLHKRMAYLRGEEIVLLSTIGKDHPERSAQSLSTLAKKQSLPAFREKGRWKVGKTMFAEWLRE